MTPAPRFFQNKKGLNNGRLNKRQPMEIIKRIKLEFEKSGMESYFIGKKAEDLLARVYFPSVN